MIPEHPASLAASGRGLTYGMLALIKAYQPYDSNPSDAPKLGQFYVSVHANIEKLFNQSLSESPQY